MIRLLATTWTVRLVLGTASLAPVMVRLAPPGMYGKPGTGDGKPGTGDGKPGTGTVSLSLAPAIRVCLAPRMAGPGTVCLLATTWTVSLHGTGDGKPGIRDDAVYVCTREAIEEIYPSYIYLVLLCICT